MPSPRRAGGQSPASSGGSGGASPSSPAQDGSARAVAIGRRRGACTGRGSVPPGAGGGVASSWRRREEPWAAAAVRVVLAALAALVRPDPDLGWVWRREGPRRRGLGARQRRLGRWWSATGGSGGACCRFRSLWPAVVDAGCWRRPPGLKHGVSYDGVVAAHRDVRAMRSGSWACSGVRSSAGGPCGCFWVSPVVAGGGQSGLSRR